jgi:hypothetical protein
MDTTPQTWTVVTGLVAVYGAVLSTWNAWVKHRDGKPRIQVKVTYGYATAGPHLGPTSLFVTAMNRGCDLTLSGAGILLLPVSEHDARSDLAPAHRMVAGFANDFASNCAEVYFLVRLTRPSFCTTSRERVYITARACELGFGGTQGLQATGAGGW